MPLPGKNYIGSVVRLAINFSNDSFVDVDPTTVAIKVMSPSGIETTYTYDEDDELLFLDTGDYLIDITPNEPGRWFYCWITTGTNLATALEGNFVVQDSPFYSGINRAYA